MLKQLRLVYNVESHAIITQWLTDDKSYSILVVIVLPVLSSFISCLHFFELFIFVVFVLQFVTLISMTSTFGASK